MKTIIKSFFLIVLFYIFFTGCSGKSDSNENDMDGGIDTDSPLLSEVTAVPTPTNVYNLVYTFSSSEAGTIKYGGSCTSSSTIAISGNNTIYFSTLKDNETYSDCTIKVSDLAENESNTLNLNSFFVNPSSIIGGTIQGADLGITIDNVTVTTLAGSGDNGSVNGTGTSASFNDPEGVTTDGTNLYVTDNHSIRKIVISTGEVTTLAGSEDNGSADGTGISASFNNPTGLTCDGTNLYVVDSGNNKIRKIVISTGAVTTIAGTGSSGSSDNSTGTSASFNNPTGITNDGTNLYVVDSGNHKIRKIVIDNSTVTTIAGSGSAGTSDATGTSAEFNSPTGITIVDNNIYVVDSGNRKIRKIVISTGVVTTIAGSSSKYGSDDHATGTEATFGTETEGPKRITSDGTNLYVSDSSNNKIRKIVIASPSRVSTLTTGSLESPVGITSDGISLFVVNKGSNILKIE